VVGYLNRVDGKPVISVTGGDEVHVSGWAACSSVASPLVQVEILVDHQAKANAAASLPRPDVAAAYGRPDFQHSGWTASFSARGIHAGTHSLTARATCTGGEAGTLPPFQLIVKKPVGKP
jgi:hypothetical protein